MSVARLRPAVQQVLARGADFTLVEGAGGWRVPLAGREFVPCGGVLRWQWQKRGIGVYWETVAKRGLDPRSGQATPAIRRRLTVDLELPRGEAYDVLIRRTLSPESAGDGANLPPPAASL